MTITLTLTTATVTIADGTAVLTALVTNGEPAPTRVVLGAFAPPGSGGASGTDAVASAAGWTRVDRPLREIAAGASEQYLVTFSPPPGIAPGSHPVRFIAYSADQAPEEHADQARQVDVIVPAAPVAAPPKKPPWWVWVAAAVVLVLIVGSVAFFALRSGAPEASPSPPPSSPTPEAPTVPLNDTVWTLTGFEDGTVPVAGSKVTLVFTPGKVSGRACNSFGGPVVVSGTSIKVGSISSTLVFCQGLMEQESRFLKTLGAATTLTQEGSTLVLRTDDGRSLTFAAP